MRVNSAAAFDLAVDTQGLQDARGPDILLKMRRFQGIRAVAASVGLASGLATLVGAAPDVAANAIASEQAGAATSPAPTPALPSAPPKDWIGRYCTPAGCAGAASNPWSTAIGFGAAAIAAGWLGRRRNFQP